jgi:hypothetical protein
MRRQATTTMTLALIAIISHLAAAQDIALPELPQFPADLGSPTANIPKGRTGERLVAAWASNNPELARHYGGTVTRAIPSNLNPSRNGFDVVVAVLDDQGQIVKMLPMEVKTWANRVEHALAQVRGVDFERSLELLRSSGDDGAWFAERLAEARRTGRVGYMTAGVNLSKGIVEVADESGLILNASRDFVEFAADGMRRSRYPQRAITEMQSHLVEVVKRMSDRKTTGLISQVMRNSDEAAKAVASSKVVKGIKVLKIPAKVVGKVLIPVGLALDGYFLVVELMDINEQEGSGQLTQKQADLRRVKAALDAILVGYLIDAGEWVDKKVTGGIVVDTAGPWVNWGAGGVCWSVRKGIEYAGETYEMIVYYFE